MWMAILLLIVVFIYSVLSFAFFQSELDTFFNFQCQTVGQCFISIVRNGLINNFMVSFMDAIIYV